MIKDDNFGVKEVPDLFFINKEDNTLVYSADTLKKFKAEYIDYGKWTIKFKTLGFCESFYQLWENYDRHYDIYCRTFKRRFKDGKDYELCFKFNNAILDKSQINLGVDDDPCDFPTIFSSDNIEIIDDKDCPKFGLNENGEKEIFIPIK